MNNEDINIFLYATHKTRFSSPWTPQETSLKKHRQTDKMIIDFLHTIKCNVALMLSAEPEKFLLLSLENMLVFVHSYGRKFLL